MILVTGGAGFIGSCLHAGLVERGHETVVVDRLGSDGKWRNLRRPPARLIPPEALDAFLSGDPRLDAVIHLGAVSSTMASDADVVWQSNVALSQRLWTWCATADVPMLYASSAATYGDGSAGFDDDMARLDRLRPLNLYGWSKHVFDLWAVRQATRWHRPPHWAGLKFFNVFGPNEYHKGPMVSVVKVKHDEIRAGRRPTLFRSTDPALPDGAQTRDFVWVGDVVAVMLWWLEHPVSGLFNVGTGRASSYRDLAAAVCAACGVAAEIDYVDMPERLRGQYQSHTEARMERLRAAGFTAPFLSLADGVGRYVREHLDRADPYL